MKPQIQRTFEEGQIRISFPSQSRLNLREALSVLSQAKHLVLNSESLYPLKGGFLRRILLPELGFWCTSVVDLKSLKWDGFSLFDMIPILASSPNLNLVRCGERFSGGDVLFGTRTSDLTWDEEENLLRPIAELPPHLFPKLERFSSTVKITTLVLREPRQLSSLRVGGWGRVPEQTDIVILATQLAQLTSTLQSLTLVGLDYSVAHMILDKMAPMSNVTSLFLLVRNARHATYLDLVQAFLDHALSEILKLALSRFPSLETLSISAEERLAHGSPTAINRDYTTVKPRKNDHENYQNSNTLKIIRVVWGTYPPRSHSQYEREWVGRQGWEFKKDVDAGSWITKDLAEGYKNRS